MIGRLWIILFFSLLLVEIGFSAEEIIAGNLLPGDISFETGVLDERWWVANGYGSVFVVTDSLVSWWTFDDSSDIGHDFPAQEVTLAPLTVVPGQATTQQEVLFPEEKG